MGRTRYKIHETGYPYFITCSVVYRIPLFSDPQVVSILIEILQYLRNERGMKLYAYCIMENHIHMIAQHEYLSRCMQSFKSFSAKRILDLLKQNNRKLYLSSLAFAKKRSKVDSEYQVWDEGFNPKQISNLKMMEQKVNYIHFNPVERGYVDKPTLWRYSSARNYVGEIGLMEVDIFSG